MGHHWGASAKLAAVARLVVLVAFVPLGMNLQGCNLFSKKSASSGPSDTAPRIIPEQALGIVGGQNAANDDIVKQSTVAIIVGQSQMRCTGTLISPNIVLSAAHCFVGAGLDNSDLNIVFGTNIQSTERRHVKALKTHERYDPNTTLGENSPLYDTSLLLLDNPAPSWTKPAILPLENAPLAPGENFIFAGFGWNYTSDLIIIRNGGGEGTLRRLNLPLTAVLESSAQLKFVSNNKAVCSGDSGGPAYLQQGSDLLVFGITSWGYTRCESGLSVFTDSRKYRSWILANLPAGGIAPGNTSANPGGGGALPVPPVGVGTTPVPNSSPQPPVVNGTATPTPPQSGNIPNAADAALVAEAQRIYESYKSGQIPNEDEVAFKTEGKRDHNIRLLGFLPLPLQNSQAAYRCVHIRNDRSSFGKAWGERSGAFVYYNFVRFSDQSNFDTFGCQYQHTSGQMLWYVQ